MYSTTGLIIFGILSVTILAGLIFIIRNIITIKRSNSDWKKRIKENRLIHMPPIALQKAIDLLPQNGAQQSVSSRF
jgi:uncharacterized protein HemY